MKSVEGKLYPKIDGSKMKTEVYKLPHRKINFEGGEFLEKVGFTYQYDGSSELSMPAKNNNDGTVTVLEDSAFANKGDKLEISTGKNPDKKTVKKTVKKVKK
jgi:hypothetical protein